MKFGIVDARDNKTTVVNFFGNTYKFGDNDNEFGDKCGDMAFVVGDYRHTVIYNLYGVFVWVSATEVDTEAGSGFKHFVPG